MEPQEMARKDYCLKRVLWGFQASLREGSESMSTLQHRQLAGLTLVDSLVHHLTEWVRAGVSGRKFSAILCVISNIARVPTILDLNLAGVAIL